eukprot:gnl/TRDRNA2_/TRDRNA2_44409_c0_seq1.p1 gnl/TRDRNA2_/TRDRNA2_44409_c0~~gnl/TRDRNA2_/TRDRNA2_44409_c0_seq1.p1  ORF type:complete len:486 (+),score=61.19 gnl/TRDRNA2_/TRDRNA2_44409_c0_seq1:115-1572(+)
MKKGSSPSDGEVQKDGSNAAGETEEPSFLESMKTFSTTSPRDLWIIYVIKIFLSFSYFALYNVLTLFLTDDFGMSDIDAGWAYGAHGFMTGIMLLLGGYATDKIGMRLALIFGSLCLVVGYGVMAYTTTRIIALIALLTFKPLGTALCMPALLIGIRRFSTPQNRAFAFSFFYVVQNLASVFSVLAITASREALADGAAMPFFSGHVTIWRAIVGLAFAAACVQFLVSFAVRPNELDDTPTDELAERRAQSPWAAAWELACDNRCQRFVVLVVIFIGVRSVFRHLDATFPKYFLRSFGPDSPFEMFLLVNPLCILLFTPVMTHGIAKARLSYPNIFLIGATLSGFSPFFLAIETSYAMCFAFVLVLSLGESIWAPKLYEYSIAIAPIGREAAYSAISTMPMFLATALIGGFSGHVLETHCPAYNNCDGQTMWLLIGLTTATSPLGLLLLRPLIFDPRDLEEDCKAGLTDADSAPNYGGAQSRPTV